MKVAYEDRLSEVSNNLHSENVELKFKLELIEKQQWESAQELKDTIKIKDNHILELKEGQDNLSFSITQKQV